MKEILMYENIFMKNDEVLLYNEKPIPQPDEENLYDLYKLIDSKGHHIGWRWRKKEVNEK